MSAVVSVADYNRRTGATVLLTSHYMADVQALAERVLVITGGELLYDGRLDHLTVRVDDTRVLNVTLAEPADLSGFGEVVATDGAKVSLRIGRGATAATTARLMAETDVVDLTVGDAPIEETIAALFEQPRP